MYHFLAVCCDEGRSFFRADRLHDDSSLGVQSISGIFQCSAAIVHAELAISWSIPGIRRITQHGVVDVKLIKDATDFTVVANYVTVEAADKVDAVVRFAYKCRHGTGFAIPKVLDYAHQSIIVASNMAADESRGVGKWRIKLSWNRTFFF